MFNLTQFSYCGKHKIYSSIDPLNQHMWDIWTYVVDRVPLLTGMNSTKYVRGRFQTSSTSLSTQAILSLFNFNGKRQLMKVWNKTSVIDVDLFADLFSVDSIIEILISSMNESIDACST